MPAELEQTKPPAELEHPVVELMERERWVVHGPRPAHVYARMRCRVLRLRTF